MVKSLHWSINDGAFMSGFVDETLIHFASESKWNLTKHLGLGGHSSVSMLTLTVS